jgi:exonuclease SbcD
MGYGRLKILHTSDWHLGRTLYGKKQRYDEHEEFLSWLLETVKQHNIDMLIVAGDIFDTATPGSRAQTLYYEFLGKIRKTGCSHVIIIAGNHDSPSLLDAPKDILAAMDITVTGHAAENPEDEVKVIKNAENQPIAIVCAAPYLRQRDLQLSADGDNISERNREIAAGIRLHYEQIAHTAEEKRKECGKKIPIIATGHLFTAGGQTVSDDGVRDLYVGSLGGVESSIFSPTFDYVALGHLHIPQKVNNQENIRYSGSPIPMGFGECRQQKQINIVTFSDGNMQTASVPVPVFQRLESIRGDREFILNKINELGKTAENVWIEIIYTGNEIWGNMSEHIGQEAAQYPQMEIIRTVNQNLYNAALSSQKPDETLDNLNEKEVFERCLRANNVPEEQYEVLRDCYNEILFDIAG